jgi:hypothetical protein
MKFSQKNIENWWRWKMSFFLVGHLNFFFQKTQNILVFSNENSLGFHARYHFFENFDDYPGLQPKITHTKQFSRQCT